MKTIFSAIALTIAMPAMANAHTAPAPAPKASNHANMMGMTDCKGMADDKAGGGHDMAAMKGHDMDGMKGHDMVGMSKQDHEKMMLSCRSTPAKGATTPSAVQPSHKM